MTRSKMLAVRSKLACGLLLVAVVAGCAGDTALLTSDPTGQALFDQGQDALVAEEWRDAVTAFDMLLRNYPSSPFLAEARLGLGRAYYEQGRVDTRIMAIDSFQSFLTYHPSHPFVDYAQYMVGLTYVQQMRTPDRDQAPTRRAIETFDRMIEDYPNSPLIPSAEKHRLDAINSLAAHELQVARYQARRATDWDAAVDRVNYALENYPENTLKCELLFTKADAYKEGEQFEDAVRYYEQVVNDYPDCELADDAQERVREINGQ